MADNDGNGNETVADVRVPPANPVRSGLTPVDQPVSPPPPAAGPSSAAADTPETPAFLSSQSRASQPAPTPGPVTEEVPVVPAGTPGPTQPMNTATNPTVQMPVTPQDLSTPPKLHSDGRFYCTDIDGTPLVHDENEWKTYQPVTPPGSDGPEGSVTPNKRAARKADEPELTGFAKFRRGAAKGARNTLIVGGSVGVVALGLDAIGAVFNRHDCDMVPIDPNSVVDQVISTQGMPKLNDPISITKANGEIVRIVRANAGYCGPAVTGDAIAQASTELDSQMVEAAEASGTATTLPGATTTLPAGVEDKSVICDANGVIIGFGKDVHTMTVNIGDQGGAACTSTTDAISPSGTEPVSEEVVPTQPAYTPPVEKTLDTYVYCDEAGIVREFGEDVHTSTVGIGDPGGANCTAPFGR